MLCRFMLFVLQVRSFVYVLYSFVYVLVIGVQSVCIRFYRFFTCLFSSYRLCVDVYRFYTGLFYVSYRFLRLLFMSHIVVCRLYVGLCRCLQALWGKLRRNQENLGKANTTTKS